MEANVQQRIQELTPQLGAQSQKLAHYLLSHGADLPDRSIQKLATDAGVSTATISRFAHQLGFANFSALKWAFLQDLSPHPTIRPVATDDQPLTVAKKTLAANVATLNGTFKQLTNAQLLAARDLLVHARRVGFFGMGGSNIVALDAYHKLLRVPLTLVHNSEYHLALMEAARFTSADCALVISHTGDDTDTLLLAATLQRNHVPMIVMTSFPNAPLAAYGDVVFYSISADSEYRAEALLSLTSQLAINDCLYMLCAQYFGAEADAVLTNMHATIFTKHPSYQPKPAPPVN